MTQQINLNAADPGLVLALRRALRPEPTPEETAQAERAARAAQAKFVETRIPPADPTGFVMLLLTPDEKHTSRSLCDIVLFDDERGDAIRFTLQAEIPAFIPARFLASGSSGVRELDKLLAAGVVALSVPLPGDAASAWSIPAHALDAWGKALGLVALGHETGRLDFAPRITQDELRRVSGMVATVRPALADALAKLCAGGRVKLAAFMPPNVTGTQSVHGWEELRPQAD